MIINLSLALPTLLCTHFLGGGALPKSDCVKVSAMQDSDINVWDTCIINTYMDKLD